MNTTATIALIKKAVPRARMTKGKLKVKNLQTFDVVRLLKNEGWKQIGRVDYDKGGSEYGFQKGKFFVKICDFGDFPYYLGDTVFYPDVQFTRIADNRTAAFFR